MLVILSRDAPKLKFLAETETKYTETVGRKPKPNSECVGLGRNIDSSMHCNLFVLDSISIQNICEIDYFHKKEEKKRSMHCYLKASMPKCTCPFTFVHVMIITFILQV